ncbi:GNAT family N-acetyltransferase [Halorubrum sp. AD140]|uniref:GNAT family N-acetyltransferase n=1 Tax=Halorubrum sp. AD140 TaxID=3050073 RepID=UPI002ACCF827|nr:GNAT family N-acetyltransferase [Halorubrum sp. AD140]MDZ5812542.1 GNAT family N-acetyltransferase [Halorubrum sp. AD140]
MSGERDADDASASAPDGFAIELAAPDDRLDVRRVLDAAMLETGSGGVDAAIDAGDAFVARFDRTGAVVGALVATRPEPARLHVDAVAVRPARRGRGIGSALVAAAVRRAERDGGVAVVTAAFDAELKGFYRELGFETVSAVDAGEPDRFRGYRRVDDGRDRQGTEARRD